jgi:hypothetical protein
MREHGQRRTGRVPVGVVGADTDQPDGCGDLPVEHRVLVGGPVVRDLHDVDRAGAGSPAGTGNRNDHGSTGASLGGLAQVTEEQARHARGALVVRRGPEDETGVVAGASRAGTRPEHPPAQAVQRPGGRIVGLQDVDARALQ